MPLTRFDLQGATAVLTLDDAATRNAIGPDMRVEVAQAVERVRTDPAIRALVITGANGHFCSGGDLRNIASAGLDNAGWRDRLHLLHSWLRDLLSLDKPVICAVDGAAFGAGFGLALAGDFVLATSRARMCVSFLKVGLVPDCGIFYTLPRIVGPQRARELMLSAREVNADEALRLGIAMEVHAPEALLPRALALARSFEGASAMAVSLIKRTTASTGDLALALSLEADAQALAMGSPEHKRAVNDFLEKRPPKFSWPA
ncbi:enoyl-CoA hydratase/isomerase family protein [Pseudorhodoferax sp. Leaf267]|uniref:enoyl-CoA hydratase/isomerase family protein n=1 Tax=Pseudorhodoferax sp. Leaf267 TaxID=1736316 RepID=UPI000700BD41|nr:enoyl-CoA hydratase/isomerase family protein [Pseudorhodoferax sp. Leaf267]KQP13587.1 enoyl-CoA hydratase [Pseudorhodoferax sp. Leaf267]